MSKVKLGILLSVGILFFNPTLFAAAYKIDPQHTTISFKVRHILTPVQGYFRQFEGTFDYDPEKPETWKTEAAIQAASIDTNVEARDKHLRSADFFDVEQYPAMTFKSTGVTDVTPTSAKLNGVLNIHGVEKPVTLDLEIHGVVTDPWGNTIASFTGTTKINRKDFGMAWNQVLETSQFLVGEEVTIVLDVAGILQA
jgi:polyisoprenoid-binding protein YceI